MYVMGFINGLPQLLMPGSDAAYIAGSDAQVVDAEEARAWGVEFYAWQQDENAPKDYYQQLVADLLEAYEWTAAQLRAVGLESF